jgi:integrase
MGQTQRNHGIRRLCADKTVSKQMLAKLVIDARMARVGMADDFEVFRVKPLREHLMDYQAHLRAKGNNTRYIAQAIAHCEAIFQGINAVFIADIDAARVETWLAELRQQTGVGISTTNHILVHVKSFTRWLTKTRPPRWPNDPLACLARLNAESDIRRQRRPPSVEEARWLLATTRSSDSFFRGLNGEDRHFAYAVALLTGLRAGELSSLLPSGFHLDTAPPVVHVQAKDTKNGEKAVQPLPQELALQRAFLTHSQMEVHTIQRLKY